MAKELKSEAELIFMPYNYILDVKVRTRLERMSLLNGLKVLFVLVLQSFIFLMHRFFSFCIYAISISWLPDKTHAWN